MAHRFVEWDGWEEGLADSILGAEEYEEEWFKDVSSMTPGATGSLYRDGTVMSPSLHSVDVNPKSGYWSGRWRIRGGRNWCGR